MNQTQPQGGAAASLGAHSKDGGSAAEASSNHSSGAPSSATRAQVSAPSGQGGSWQQTGAELAEEARDGIGRVAAGVRDAAGTARDAVATHGSQAVHATGQLVRDQPMMALAVTGIACFALGMMIGRGRY